MMSKYVLQRLHFSNVQLHPFHMVNESPWPIIGACAALLLTVGGVWALHWGDASMFFFALMMVFLVMFVWWSDIIIESTYLGYHTSKVVQGLKLGMILFIASEVMFFFSFFWAFFHASLSPSVIFGSMWPPLGVPVLNPLQLPLLNTIILLSSGVSVTWAHHSLCHTPKQKFHLGLPKLSILNMSSFMPMLTGEMIMKCYHELTTAQRMHDEDDDVSVIPAKFDNKLLLETELALKVTLLLALEFTCCQAYEYYEALFYINDGVFGSTFFVATGFHGLHVIMGTIFLAVALGRLMNDHFTFNHHVGFELAIWYWHFVDVVWLVLYVFIYCWSGGYDAM